jgi:hypothetical protein
MGSGKPGPYRSGATGQFILTKVEMKYYISHSYKNGEKTGLKNNEIFFMRFGNGYDYRGVAVFCIS